jgi:hypothetical protein
MQHDHQPRSSVPRRERLARVLPIADQQAQLLTRAQLYAAGWTVEQVRHEIDLGRWRGVAPSVVALQNATLTHAQRLWLGVLHAGNGSVLSHVTACIEGGLRWTPPPVIEVLTAKGDLVAPLPGFFFRQTRRRYDGWVARTSGPPRLDIPHAAILAAERDRHVRRAIGLLAATVQQGLATPDSLLLAVDGIRKVRHGDRFRLALGDIAGGAQSFAEIDIGRICGEAGLAPPSRQRIRKDRTGRRRFLDCEWELPDGRTIVLEIDGSFHMLTDHWWRDMKRERSIVIGGSSVLRCSSIEIRLEPVAIANDLRAIGVPACDRPAA